MPGDPIVAEVRRARDAYARRFNYDLEAIVKDLQQQELRSGANVVSFPPKRPRRGTPAGGSKRSETSH